MPMNMADVRHAELTAADVAEFVDLAAAALARNEALLDRLDAALGDGDHGTNMAMGFAAAVPAARAALETHPDDVGELLRLLGHSLVASVGGASGPLYGTAFIEVGAKDLNRLFVPFSDTTAGTDTYPGGRFLGEVAGCGDGGDSGRAAVYR